MISTVSRLLSLAQAIRMVEDTFNANDLFVLAFVHRREGCTVDDLVTAMSTLAPSSVSRICARLGDHSSKVVGHGFLTLVVDPDDARKRRVYITPKGRRFLTLLESHMDGVPSNLSDQAPPFAA